MHPRLSLLDELRKGGYEASLVTTFNAFLPFYEEVVLRRLTNAGVRHNVLLMDARQYSISIQTHPPRLAGRRYTLAPIAVPGAFHPKLIFLVGKHKGLVVVGSHNMTIAGFGFNRELTNVIRIRATDDEAGLAIATRVWLEVMSWIDSSSDKLPHQIRHMVARVKDFAPWLKARTSQIDGDVQVLAGRAGAPSLWKQVRELLTAPVKEAFVTGAFFDAKLSFLKQIHADLQPERIVVAIDPATVDIPFEKRRIAGVCFVRANSLGAYNDGKDRPNGYLHAKGIYLRLQNNDCVFISGSANPSAPAWLATQGDGNTELVVARLGANSREVASQLGFAGIFQLPPLDDNDWQIISNSSSLVNDVAPTGCRVGVAVVVGNEIRIDAVFGTKLQRATLFLLDAHRQEISSGGGLKTRARQYAAKFPHEQIEKARFLRCVIDEQSKVDFLLHHARVVEKQARTSTQKRFKEALLSLQTDTPNIGLLLECLDKIAFAETATQTPTQIGRTSPGRSKADNGHSTPESLAVDVDETKKPKSRPRLAHNGDLGYLLDTLIFHLRLQEDRARENVDRLGRSEEEQVGADDSEDGDETHLTERDRVDLLKACHAKVRLVVRRMNKQLNAYAKRRQSLDAVLIRLLSVLAVLRELRRCDGRAPWVDQGKTTVPVEERLQLLDEVMFSLFEGTTSLLHLESLGDEVATSEDIARLKGLLLWLAWDCGLQFDLNRPFMEAPKAKKARLSTNAKLLALAQSIRADEKVLEEAQQSIGTFTTSDMDWLNAICNLATQCDAAKSGELAARAADGAVPGDVAIHRKLENWDLRVVAGVDGKYVSLIKLCRSNERILYTPINLLATRLYANPLAATQGQAPPV